MKKNILLLILISQISLADDSNDIFKNLGGKFAQATHAPDSAFQLGKNWYSGYCVDATDKTNPYAGLLGSLDNQLPIWWHVFNLGWILRETTIKQGRDLYRNGSVVERGSSSRQKKYYFNRGNFLIFTANTMMMEYRQTDSGEVVSKISCPDALFETCFYKGKFFRTGEAFTYCSFQTSDRMIDMTLSPPLSQPHEKPIASPGQLPTLSLPEHPDPIATEAYPGIDPQLCKQMDPAAEYIVSCRQGLHPETFRVFSIALQNRQTRDLGESWFVQGTSANLCGWVKLKPEAVEQLNSFHLNEENKEVAPYAENTWYKILQISTQSVCR